MTRCEGKQTILSDFSSFFFPYNASTDVGEEKQTILSDFSSFFFPYNTSTEGEEEKQTILSDFSSLSFYYNASTEGGASLRHPAMVRYTYSFSTSCSLPSISSLMISTLRNGFFSAKN